MLLFWSMLLLCFSANAENIIYRETGQSVTLKCSSAGCLNSIEKYVGMYLYKGFGREKVIYYHPKSTPKSEDKITPGPRYKDRIQTKGSLWDHTITISSLNLNDSGSYICEYRMFPKGEDQCNNYTLDVKDPQYTTVPPSHIPHKADYYNTTCGNPEGPFLWIIIPTAAISMLVTTIFTLLIIPRVKHWICSRMTGSTLEASGDCVYVTMTKNGVQCPAVAEQSLDSPYGIVA